MYLTSTLTELQCIAQDPEHPLAAPCTQCYSRGKPDECDGRKWPKKRRRQDSVAQESEDNSTSPSPEFISFQSEVFSRLDDLSSSVTNLDTRMTKIYTLLLRLERSGITFE